MAFIATSIISSSGSKTVRRWTKRPGKERSLDKGESTGINNVAAVSAKKAAKKAIVDGRLVIEKNGKQFSVAGAQIK